MLCGINALQNHCCSWNADWLAGFYLVLIAAVFWVVRETKAGNWITSAKQNDCWDPWSWYDWNGEKNPRHFCSKLTCYKLI